ncbi:Competence protein A [Anatilimnocola aggregata]|uniref:Competence protein A n=1 Tax=Anatilimnocola aggregata TaxID=2528021 RepID=A0A517YEX4_9BACT|nr:pilus assembly protein PilM [Anatilimnocola aggregata]QDU28785.1 Competence protein A [Anatilimnocola aggregata]
MISWLGKHRCGPVGVDLGARSIKLVQLSADRLHLIDACRWELPPIQPNTSFEQHIARWSEGLAKALEGRAFRGREVVVCLGDRQLFLQNVRVPREMGAHMHRLVAQEAAGRLPFGIDEAELRFVEAADVRQGDATLREVIVFACQRTVLQQTLQMVETAKLNPVAVDVEPAALARCYAAQFRREDDKNERALIVHVGYSRTAAVIAQGDEMLFVKYIEIGGSHFDAAIARHLKMDASEATLLRKHNGDRRSDMQDPEVARSVAEASRPVIERLGGELSMCIRYHSVTFRGQPLVRMVLGGGESTPQLLESLGRHLDVKCELSDPFRSFPTVPNLGRKGQWDVATGLALRELN